MRRAMALTALALVPAVGAEADPATSVFPSGWRQGWTRSVEGQKLSYRWGYPGFAVSLLCRAVDPTWAIEWDGEPPPAVAPRRRSLRLERQPNSGTSPHRFELRVRAARSRR
jgi:hypothetical protein